MRPLNAADGVTSAVDTVAVVTAGAVGAAACCGCSSSLHPEIRRVPERRSAATVRPPRLRMTLIAPGTPMAGLNQIGRAHVRTSVTNAHPVCPLLLAKKKQ